MQKRKSLSKKETSGLKRNGSSSQPVGGTSSSISSTDNISTRGHIKLTSYDIFQYCIERAKNLIKIHGIVHGKKSKPPKEFSDVPRAAILLAISALDAFIRTLVISEVRNILADKTRPLHESLLTKIKKYINHDAVIDAARKDDLIDRVEKILQIDFDKKSFQGTKNITEGMQILGHDDIFNEVALKAKMNEETLRKDLDNFTERRHTIAHRGDYDLSQKPPVENVITKKYANDCIKLVIIIASHINNIKEK